MSESSSRVAAGELRRFIEDAAARLESALADSFTGAIQSPPDDPAARRLGQAVDRLLQAARQVEARAQAIARDRDGLDRDLVELQARLAEEITERERTQREARQQRTVVRGLLDSLPYCIFWKDRDGVYLGANQNKVRALGLQSVDQLIGKTDYDTAISRENADFYRSVDRQVMDSGEPILNLEEIQQRPDGPHLLLTSKIPLRDAGGAVMGVLGMYVDVTERTRVQGAPHEPRNLDSMQSLLRLGRAVG